MTVFLVITALVLINALYVAAEFAVVSIRRSRVEQLSEEGHWLAQRLRAVVQESEKLDDYVAACQVGITLANLLLGVYGQIAVANAIRPWLSEFGGMQSVAAESIATTVTLLSLTTVMMVFGELLPKSIALRFSEKVALWTVPPMGWSLALLKWPIAFFNGSGNALLRLFKIPMGRHHQIFSPQEIGHLVSESQKGGELKRQEGILLKNLLRFTERRLQDVMVPRTRITGVEVETPATELLLRLAHSPFSRLPVYQDDMDHIVGILHIKDLLHHELTIEQVNFKLKEILRPVLYEPQSAAAGPLLKRMQKERIHMAVVVDEYGGTAGLVTLEDLLEEIVGDVQDEFDQEVPPFRELRDGRLRIRGDVSIQELNERYELDLEAENVLTIAGLMMAHLGRMLKVGDKVQLPHLELRVQSIDERGFQTLMLTRKSP